jgi:mono/diheme cytochrome c family protein
MALASLTASGQTRPPRGLDGLFSPAQTEHGAQVFSGQCAGCHTPAQASAYMMERSAGASFAEYQVRLAGIMPPMSSEPPDTQSYVDIMG